MSNDQGGLDNAARPPTVEMPSSPGPAMFGEYPTRAERLADLWVHMIGVTLGLMGGGVLVGIAYLNDGVGRATSVSAYVLFLLIMFSVSAAANLANVVHHHRRLLQNSDEASIFLMIAGSYTPFTTQILHGALAIGMTLAIWCLALAAAAGKLFVPGISRRVWMLAYLVLGWMVILAIGPLVEGLPPVALILLIAGGATYTIGTISYAAPKLRFRRAIWHTFVLFGAAMHFGAILTGIVLA